MGDHTARIEVCGLTKHFGGVAAVDDVSFTVEPGSVTGFLGPNGAGKTTTLRMLLGLVRPDRGGATIGEIAYVDLEAPGRHGSRSPAASWSPGSPTTCVRRSQGSGRWPRLSRTGSPPTHTATTRRIRVEVDRLARLVDDLFELSRIQAGALTLTPEPVLLGDLVSEALAGADPVARERRVRLGGQVEDGLEITADPASLSRVVSNLLMNAIRHTPADGTVEVHCRLAPGDVRSVDLSVSDGCGGLDPGDMERVFDLGWQGSSARTPTAPEGADGASAPGAGFGLAIVKGLVDAHRGRVWVENLPAATGCRFHVRLPA